MMLYGSILYGEMSVNDGVKQIDKEEDELLDSLTEEKVPEPNFSPKQPSTQKIESPTPTPQINSSAEVKVESTKETQSTPSTTPNSEKSIEEKIAIVDAQIKEQERKVQEAELKAKQEAEAKEAAQLRAKLEAEERAKQEAIVKAEQEAEAKARLEAEAKAKVEAEARVKAEAEARMEAEEKAKKEAQLAATKEAEEIGQKEADLKAKKEAEAIETAKREDEARAEAKAKKEAELKLKNEPKKLTKEEAIAKAKEIAKEQMETNDVSKELQAILPMVLDAISIDEMDGLDIDQKRAVITLKKKLEKERAQVEAKKLFDQALQDAIRSVR